MLMTTVSNVLSFGGAPEFIPVECRIATVLFAELLACGFRDITALFPYFPL